MAVRTYYDILGVSSDADQDEIKRAYRALARKYHPDTAGNDDALRAKFQEIQEAYECLSDPIKRRNYAYYGHTTYRSSYYAQHGGPFSEQSTYYEEEYYEEDGCSGCGACGGEGHSHGAGGHHHHGAGGHHHGNDGCGHDGGECDGSCGGHGDGGCGGHGHSHGHGGVKDGHCGACEEGRYDEDGVKEGHCGACEEGRYTHDEDNDVPPPKAIRIGVWLEPEEMLSAQDKEVIYQEKDGAGIRKGTVKKAWHFTVHIPARSYDHQYFYMFEVLDPDEPFLEYANTYPDGKVFVIIVMIREKKGFTRQLYHLFTETEVDYPTLVLGGEVEVPGIGETVAFEVPPGTRPEQRVRITGKGMVCPPKYGDRGDLYVTLHVRIPKALTPRQRQLIEMLREAMKEVPEDEVVTAQECG